jgi:hypothetical protein
MSKKLVELLRYEGPELSQQFEKASISGRGTPQEIADLRENALRDFLARYFPLPYRVAKGNIIDTFGHESDSIDCVLLNPAHPHTIDRYDKFTVILADAVDAAIELKPDLQNYIELERGLRQMTSVKKLQRSETPLFLPEQNPPHIVEHSKRVPTFLFCEKVKSDPVDTCREIVEFYRINEVPVFEQVDFVIVNGLGIIANYKYPEETFSRAKQTGFFWEAWGKDTISAFLYKINWVIPSVASISDPILKRYLRSLIPEAFVFIENS